MINPIGLIFWELINSLKAKMITMRQHNWKINLFKSFKLQISQDVGNLNVDIKKMNEAKKKKINKNDHMFVDVLR